MGRITEGSASNAVAETLRAERAASGMTQAEVARKAGIPRPTYLRYETGERRPTVVQVMQIAEALGLPFSTLTRRMQDRLQSDGHEPHEVA